MTALDADCRHRLELHRVALERAVLGGAAPEAARLELAETKAAIARIDEGTYGLCDRCGGAIGRQRLLALPTTRYCVSCAPAARINRP